MDAALSRNMLIKNLGMPAIVALLLATVVIYGNPTQAAAQPVAVQKGGIKGVELRSVPIAVSGNNLYVAWPNNDTGHWNVFYAKSVDGGKTLKTIMVSAPNKGNTIDLNTQISASGNNVYVTWWTNKTGALMPVFRASNDNGDTFAKVITLNSTG
jgi:hypothetical protein